MAIPASSAPKGLFLGVAFRRVGATGGHAGLAWREKSGDLVVLNQRWHMQVTLDAAPDPTDAVVQINVPRARVAPTIIWAKRVLNTTGGRVPYAFRLPTTVFDKKTGELLLRRGEGVTCSTFVIALLESAGISLLKLAEWPARQDDEKRHRELAEQMRQGYVKRDGQLTPEALEHLAYLNVQMAAIRYRPEEAAGAASVHPLPASFEAATSAATSLLALYDAHFPPPAGEQAAASPEPPSDGGAGAT